ncbi:AMP-binding protein [Streptomyces gobitricini]|uniref:Fatty acyl-AMP ligase n=1 Tax=Streptomyces gobitricini TaxID=68211 RepID=A0ABN3LNK6_9ACTN
MSSAPPIPSVAENAVEGVGRGEDPRPVAPAPAGSLVRRLLDRATGPGADRHLFTALGAEGERIARLTPAELDARARAVAAALRGTGRPGDRVIIPPMPGLDFHVAFFGCLYAGMVAVPVADATGPAAAAIARDCRPSAVLVAGSAPPGPSLGVARVAVREQSPASHDRWDGPVPPAPGAPALLQYAQRPAERPRGLPVGHGTLAAGQAAVRDRCDIDTGTTVVSWLPLWHGTGLGTALVLPLMSGAASVTLEPAAFVRDPRVWLRAIEAEEDVFAAAPDIAYELCVRRVPAAERMRIDLSTWRVAAVGGNGGQPVRARTLRRFADAFRPGFFREEMFAAGYGPGEGALGVTLARPLYPTVSGRYDRGALARGKAVPVPASDRGGVELVGRGTPLPGTEVRVVDPVSYRPLPERAVGEIRVAVAGGGCDRAGTRTGDLGFLDGGELFVTGRTAWSPVWSPA